MSESPLSLAGCCSVAFLSLLSAPARMHSRCTLCSLHAFAITMALCHSSKAVREECASLAISTQEGMTAPAFAEPSEDWGAGALAQALYTVSNDVTRVQTLLPELSPADRWLHTLLQSLGLPMVLHGCMLSQHGHGCWWDPRTLCY